MSVHKKLMEARLRLQAAELKKTGHNKFAGYYYFEQVNMTNADRLFLRTFTDAELR